MKFLVFTHIILCSFFSNAQDTQENFPKFNFEIGAGLQYSQLKEFNEALNSGTSESSLNEPMHIGYSLNFGVNYNWTKALSVGVLFQLCEYSTSQYKADLIFEDPMPGGPNFNYDLELKRKLSSIRLGLGANLFFDQIKPKATFSRINYGVYLECLHGFGHHRYDRTLFQWGQGEGSLTRLNNHFNYTNFRYGLVIALNFKNYQRVKTLLRTGIQHTLRSSLETYTSSGSQEVNTDFTGAHTSLVLRISF